MREEAYRLMHTVQRKMKDYRPKCFLADCGERAIRSHLQSRRAFLNHICENGHVIAPSSDFWTLVGSADASDCFRQIGVTKASTFYGFCERHDHEYFKRVDSVTAKSVDKRALTEAAFRAFAYEVRTKQKVLHRFRLMERYGEPVIDIDYCRANAAGVANFLRVSYPFYMEKWLPVLKDGNYDGLKHMVYEFDENIGISCSSSLDLSPDLKKEKEILENLQIPRPLAFFSILPGETTVVVFSYFGDQAQTVKGLIRRYDSLLSQLTFNHCEEVLFRPSLFRSLSRDVKSRVIKGLRGWSFWQPVDFSDVFPALVLSSHRIL